MNANMQDAKFMPLFRFDHLFHNYSSPCAYGLPHQAVYRQVAAKRIDSAIFDELILSGHRRAGNVIYRMACPSCRACVPIRMRPGQVRYGNTQRKIKNKNRDMEAAIQKPEFTEEKLALYQKFLSLRYPGKEIPGRADYEDFFIRTCVDTWEVCYSLDGKIVGVAIVDIGQKVLNGVYFFFDPALEKRSPGVYNFLYLNEFCKEKGINYFATGFYIRDVPAMDYKARFYPHELLMDGEWRKVEKHRVAGPQAKINNNQKGYKKFQNTEKKTL